VVDSPFTVRRLISETEFGLVALTGEMGLDRTIQGVHHSDLPSPAPWMQDDTVLISHGGSFKESEAEGCAYLDRIVDKTVCLVLAVGTYVDGVTRATVEYARELGLPLLTLPKTVPIRSIHSYVYHALAATDMYRLRRALAMHSRLLDLLVEQRGVPEIISRLADMLNARLILFDRNGSILAEAGNSVRITPHEVWMTYARAPEDWGPMGILEADHGRVRIRRVFVHGVLERVLGTVVDGPRDDLSDMALSYTERLLALDVVHDRDWTEHVQRARSLLLNEYLSCGDEARTFVEPFRVHGVDLGQTWRFLVFQTSLAQDPASSLAGSCPFESRLAASVDAQLHAAGVPAVSGIRGELLVTLAVTESLSPASIRRAIEGLVGFLRDNRVARGLVVGVSSPQNGPSYPEGAFEQAVEAARTASEGIGVSDGIVLFEEAGARFRLLDGQSIEALRMMQERVVQPITDYDRKYHSMLLPTLRSYFFNDMSVHRTASDLHVHRNTLRKRLRRIEGLLGVRLDSVDDAFEVFIALRASELVEPRVAGVGTSVRSRAR
jgi:PucR family transcriptional regulator, purine catabolism regulatory protein